MQSFDLIKQTHSYAIMSAVSDFLSHHEHYKQDLIALFLSQILIYEILAQIYALLPVLVRC
jgi:hypothetical protein